MLCLHHNAITETLYFLNTAMEDDLKLMSLYFAFDSFCSDYNEIR